MDATVTRRDLLKLGAGAVAAGSVCCSSSRRVPAERRTPRRTWPVGGSRAGTADTAWATTRRTSWTRRPCLMSFRPADLPR